MRLHPFRCKRFTAYPLGVDYWVTIEWLPLTDDANVRWVWTVRTIVFRTANSAVVPAREPIARGYAWTKAEARGRAHAAAVAHSDATWS